MCSSLRTNECMRLLLLYQIVLPTRKRRKWTWRTIEVQSSRALTHIFQLHSTSSQSSNWSGIRSSLFFCTKNYLLVNWIACVPYRRYTHQTWLSLPTSISRSHPTRIEEIYSHNSWISWQISNKWLRLINFVAKGSLYSPHSIHKTVKWQQRL